jgi:hypothetical protein
MLIEARYPPIVAIDNGARSSRPFAVLLALALLLPAATARAVSQDSPEVLALVDKGLAYLDTSRTDEMGGKCLIALAYYKRGAPKDHPKIKEAIESCKNALEEEKTKNYNYGKALAIIFLTEMDSAAHRDLIDKYAGMLADHQKPHGGFGYQTIPTGDTSQTQYAALAYWHMLNHGISPSADSVQRCLNWLMRTRDPSGVWGYQGQDPGTFDLIAQNDKPGVSMAAAGMCGVMILGNSMGMLKPAAASPSEATVSHLPPSMHRIEDKSAAIRPTLPAGDISRQRLTETLQAGRAWFDKNFTLQVFEYQSYYLYSVERYRSFEEYLAGTAVDEPKWYNDGYELLKSTQNVDGSWSDQAGAPSATAFSILFLLRSTQKSIAASLGEGTLVGGRGLPRDLSKVRLRGGKLVVEQKPTEVDELLNLLDDSHSDALDSLLDDPAALQVTNVGPEEARRLQQVARSGGAAARLLAVRALGRLRNLDYAPTLVFALTDPDKRVVREARDALRSVSRNFEGFGPPDNFDDGQRDTAVQRWKNWYHTVRPDAPPLP